jgi:hypothetical protein
MIFINGVAFEKVFSMVWIVSSLHRFIGHIGEFDQLDPYVARAGFAPASDVAKGHTLPF